jgi:hypothetical protein
MTCKKKYDPLSAYGVPYDSLGVYNRYNANLFLGASNLPPENHPLFDYMQWWDCTYDRDSSRLERIYLKQFEFPYRLHETPSLFDSFPQRSRQSKLPSDTSETLHEFLYILERRQVKYDQSKLLFCESATWTLEEINAFNWDTLCEVALFLPKEFSVSADGKELIFSLEGESPKVVSTTMQDPVEVLEPLLGAFPDSATEDIRSYSETYGHVIWRRYSWDNPLKCRVPIRYLVCRHLRESFLPGIAQLGNPKDIRLHFIQFLSFEKPYK